MILISLLFHKFVKRVKRVVRYVSSSDVLCAYIYIYMHIQLDFSSLNVT